MKYQLTHLALFAFGIILTGKSTLKADSNWPSWRGSTGNGTAPDSSKPPKEWSEEKNIFWKINLPGLGHSTPIIWKDKIFLTSAIAFGEKKEPPIYDNAPGSHDNLPVAQKHKFVVFCIDKITGKIIWETTCNESFPHEGGHKSGSLASASPVTDGKQVIAYFGSHGLYSVDCQSGKILWKRDLGKMATKHGHGEGSSPVLKNNTIIINWDHEKESAIYAIDKNTGKNIWKVDRKEVTSWSTPLIVKSGEKNHVIVSSTDRIRGYDMNNGKVIWECSGMSNNVVASPVSESEKVYLGCSYDKRAMIAIDIKGAKGDITDTDHVMWSTNKRTPYVPSPLLYKGTLYYLSHYQGILSVTHAESGETKAGPFRISALREIYSSPIGAGDHIYITSREGLTIVLSHEGEPKPVAFNKLDDSFSASAAISNNQIFLRGEKFLYCIGSKK
ncbi:MAG: hypothetical protein CMO69_08240 [Verrucomicrobiales bacterium]|nr:hypothetical protein [Verrucomicrobiales bacterium]